MQVRVSHRPTVPKLLGAADLGWIWCGLTVLTGASNLCRTRRRSRRQVVSGASPRVVVPGSEHCCGSRCRASRWRTSRRSSWSPGCRCSACCRGRGRTHRARRRSARQSRCTAETMARKMTRRWRLPTSTFRYYCLTVSQVSSTRMSRARR